VKGLIMTDQPLANTTPNSAGNLTRGGLLARNTVLNFIGQGTPFLVAIIAIPLLIKGLGTDRFGILTLAWMIIGYFSLFDLGLGRALTKLAAEKLGAEHEQELPGLVYTALFLMLVFGLLGTLVAIIFSPWLVQSALKIPHALQSETLLSFYLLALSIPVVISTAGLRGLLEAHQCFGLINAVRIPMGVFTFLGPLLVLPFSRNLLPIVAVLATGRFIAWLVHLILCFHIMPLLRHGIIIKRNMVRPLLSFGSWMTVSNVVGPLMTHMDRFVIGALISVTAVAYYATPYEVVTRLLFISGALIGVLFPAFSASFAQDSNRTALLFSRGFKYLFMVLFPIVLFIVTLAYEGLDLWLGAEFAQKSTSVLRWLAIGVFLNCLAQIPFALIQGIGRPDLTAKLHLIELPFYLLGVWWLIGVDGIEGAAIAWVARVAVDTIVFFAMAMRFLPGGTAIARQIVLAISIALLTFCLPLLLESVVINVIFLFLILLTFVLVSWFLLLSPKEQGLVKQLFRFHLAK